MLLHIVTFYSLGRFYAQLVSRIFISFHYRIYSFFLSFIFTNFECICFYFIFLFFVFSSSYFISLFNFSIIRMDIILQSQNTALNLFGTRGSITEPDNQNYTLLIYCLLQYESAGILEFEPP